MNGYAVQYCLQIVAVSFLFLIKVKSINEDLLSSVKDSGWKFAATHEQSCAYFIFQLHNESVLSNSY